MTIPMPGPGDPFRHPSRRPAPRWNNDQVIAASVVARLVGDYRTCEEPIAVEVQNRVAILTGRVESPDAAFVAGYLAWQTPGITDVCNAIEVEPDPDEPDDWPTVA
jgi:osmotically-inducible protein OsmY